MRLQALSTGRLPLFPFYTCLVWLRWVVINIYWYWSYCQNAFYNCNRSRIIVNLVVLFSLDVSLSCFHLLTLPYLFLFRSRTVDYYLSWRDVTTYFTNPYRILYISISSLLLLMLLLLLKMMIDTPKGSILKTHYHFSKSIH